MQRIVTICLILAASGLGCQEAAKSSGFQPTDRPIASLSPPAEKASSTSSKPATTDPDPDETQAATAQPAPPPQPRYYTITKNDTLWSISARHLGNGARYKEILKLNPGLDPSALAVGSKIALPPK